MKGNIETVTLKEVLKFIKNNYYENYWKNGIGKLTKIISTYDCGDYSILDLCSYSIDFSKNQKFIVKANYGRRGLPVSLRYVHDYLFEKSEDGTYKVTTNCDQSNRIMKKIYKHVNADKIYNFDKSFVDNDVKAIYYYKDHKVENIININKYGIKLYDFNLKYEIEDNKLNISNYNKTEEEMVDISVDSHILNHITVKFRDLPDYMKENWNTYYKKSKKTNVFKIFSDYKSESIDDKLLDTRSLYVCIYNNTVGLFKKENIHSDYSKYNIDLDIYIGIDTDNVAAHLNYMLYNPRDKWYKINEKLPKVCDKYKVTCEIDKSINIENIRLQMYTEGKINNYQIGVISTSEIPNILKYAHEKHNKKEEENLVSNLDNYSVKGNPILQKKLDIKNSNNSKNGI